MLLKSDWIRSAFRIRLFEDSRNHSASPKARGEVMRRALFLFGLFLCLSAGCPLGAQAIPPSAPSNLVSAADSQTQISLSWTDTATNESGFRIERAASSTGTWSQIGRANANTTNYANTGLATNALWYYRVCATNVDGASAYANTANAHTAYASEYGGVAVWRVLLLVYTNTDVDYTQGGTNKHYTGAMSVANRDEGVWAFHQFLSLANELSDREAVTLGDVVYSPNAITNLSLYSTDSYYVNPADIAGDLSTYDPSGRYDSILVYWHPGAVPTTYLGLGGGPDPSAHGATFGQIIEWGGWDGEGKDGEAWVHEWGHGMCVHEQNLGHRMPTQTMDGKGAHGYTGANWEYYYDLFRDRVWETNPPPSDYTGTPVQGWHQAGPLNHRAQAQADWFYLDSCSRYTKTGAIAWDSANLDISMGAAGNADHEMWTPVIVGSSITVRASIWVPPSPGGTNYTALAVKSGTNEWRAALEYGTNLVKMLALRRDGVAESTSAMTLTSGWYTVVMELDYETDTVWAKAWKRDENEPLAWQTTGTLAAAYVADQFGFHHFGSAANVDDLVLTSDLPPQFEEIAAGLPAVSLGVAAWGDYDSDGNLDLLLAGQGNSGDVAAVYRNLGGGTFTDIGLSLPTVREAAGAWADYDRDGDLDFVLCGWSTNLGARFTRIYRNDGGGVFTQAASLTGVNNGAVAWGDVDNDGDLDLIVQGWSSDRSTKLYRNDGGETFTEVTTGIIAVERGALAWGDYDNDGDLDLLITGGGSGGEIARVYRNDGGTNFIDIGAGLLGVSYRSVAAWGDYDNDGDLDIFLMGYNGGVRYARVYRNDGGVFTYVAAGLAGGADAGAAWGDLDNDGDLDLCYSGYQSDARLYRNDGGGAFSAYPNVLPDLRDASVAWGDYDRDGRLDLLLAGYTGSERLTKLYRNVSAAPLTNSVPGAPSALGSVTNGTIVTLTWAAASDAQTPSAGLTYNLRAGTSPGAIDLVAPMSDTNTGWRMLPAMGNVQHGLSAQLLGLLPGQTVYWSVQAVDSALAGGSFALQASFTAPRLPDVVTAPVTNITATSAACGGDVTNEGTSAVSSRGCVWDTAGNPTIETRAGMTTNGTGLGTFTSSLTGLTSGQVYYVRAYASNSAGVAYGEQRIFGTSMTAPGNALDLDGTNGSVSIADSASLGMTNNYTLECWFKADSFGSLRGLISKYQTAGANGYLLRLNGTDLEIDQRTTSGLNLQTGRWYHVAAVNSNGVRTLYLNGVPQALSGTALNVKSNSNALTLGSDFGGRNLNGQMDEIRIWSTVRSQDEIRDAMHVELTGTETGLAAYYTCNNSSGSLLLDMTSSGNTGTVVNGAAWIASTYPCTSEITNRTNLRAVWTARTNSLASGRMSVVDGVVTGLDFAVFGHDGAAETENAVDKPTNVQWRLNRVWQADESGSLTGGVSFDTSGWTTNFALLEDADGVFTNASIRAGMQSSTNFTAPGVALHDGYFYTMAGVALASVTTDPATDVDRHTATGGGQVISAGDMPVTARGVCWSTATNPTTANPCTTNGSGTGVFSAGLAGLTTNTLYHVRAYAISALGTAYGEDVQFTTLPGAPPTVTTATPSNITSTTAAGGGNVTSEGAAPVTARGCVWNTAGNPSLLSHTGITSDGNGPGEFSSSLTGLTPGQTYYVRAYATNEDGVAYGSQQSILAAMTAPGNALDLDGTNDYVSIADSSSLDLTNNYTLECWFKADVLSGLRGLVDKYHSPAANGYFVRLNGTNLNFDEMTTSNLNLQAGRWYHVAAINSNGTRRLYLNGMAQSLYGTPMTVQANNNVLALGADYLADNNRYFNGQMDEVRVWNTVRSLNDIRDNMHKELAGNEANLVACYRFNYVSGTNLVDVSGNGNSGTLVNGPVWVTSTIPCAAVITNRYNLRGLWSAQTNSLGSDRFSLTNGVASGLNYVLFGHDNGTNDWIASDMPTNMARRLGRVWCTEPGGASTADLALDTAGLSILDPNDFCMMVCTDGVFANAGILTGYYTNNVYTVAAQSLTGGVYYTLGKLANLATVTTAPISNVAPFSASGGGEVTFEGSGGVTARGVCWSAGSTPTTNDEHTTDGNGLGAFNSSLTNLTPSTPYFVRAYAINNSGAAYGDVVAFTTLTAFAQVTTAPITNITHNTAQSGGDVTNEGGYPVTARGVCWNIAGSPTTNDSRTTDGSGAGPFVSQLTGLSGAQTYHVRAYAVNAAGASYGGESSFTTLATPPGNALDFNDASTVNGSGVPLITNNQVTLECWVNHDNLASNRISRYVTLDSEIAVIRHDSGNAGRLHAYFKINGSLRSLVVDNVLQTGRWYHVAGVWDRTNINLYLNGILLTNANYAGMSLATNSGGIGLGSAGEYLNGRLDEVRIWNVARSASELRDAMHMQLTGTETGLVTYYRCNEGTGTALRDLVGGSQLTNFVNVGWATSTFPCADLIADRTNIRGAWLPQPNSLSSSILTVSNAAVGGTDFRVFGHDNGTLSANASDKPAAYAWRLNRAWRAEGTGALTGSVVFDCSGLSGLITNTAYLRLLADADGVFTDATAVSGLYTASVFTVSGQSLSNGVFYTLAEGGWPTVTTAPISNITHVAAQGGGNVTAAGASLVSARGVCWNTTGNPTTNDNRTVDGSGAGAFASSVTGLSAQTLYYLRAYAVNAQGVGYGDEHSFTTLLDPPGRALDFDGTNDYVAISDANLLDLTNNYTLECWFKADSLSGLRGLIDKYQTASANGYLLRLNGTELEFDQLGTTGLNLQPGRWYHAAAVNSNGTRTLYVNGLARTITGSALSVQANTNELRLGCDYSTRFYDGQLDEVRVWSVALNETQVRDAMHRQLDGTQAGLVACYDFNTNSGVLLPDLTTNHLNGTLTNGPVWIGSTFPCANAIETRTNLRGAWSVQTNSLSSSIFSVSNAVVTGLWFRVFGHDSGALTGNSSDAPVSCAWRLNRTWQFEGTGALTGDLVFDCAGVTNLIGSGSRLRLLIDGDGVFADASVIAGVYSATFFKVAGQSVTANGYCTLGEQALRTITAAAGVHGNIVPSGAVQVVYGGTTNFAVLPDVYWHVGDVTTNGGSVGAVTNFVWSNVVADGTINATFAADVAAHGTPDWWLAQYGWTNNFDAAETNDTDGDRFPAWQEQIAGTDPTVSTSFFQCLEISSTNFPTLGRVLRWNAVSGRVYSVDGANDLSQGWLGLATNLPPVGAWTDTTHGADRVINYRMEVSKP